MNTLSFPQKNDLVVKHKSKEHFSKDLELFQKHFPSHRLMNDLARANEFTFDRLDGQMLYLLLEKIPMDEILKNRTEDEKKEVKKSPSENPPVSTDPPASEDSSASLIPPIDEKLIDEKLKALEEKIESLQERNDSTENEISDLQSDLEDKDSSISALETKIDELKKESPSKKKEKPKNSPE
jgi:hypothetical protein